jgi:large subunit ribosomal protein L10
MSATAARSKTNSAADRLGRQVRTGIVRHVKGSLTEINGVVVFRVEKVATKEINALRTTLESNQSSLFMVKNSLARLAFRELGWAGLEQSLEGTCGISPVQGDISAVCRLLHNFSKDHEGFVLKGGVLDGQVLPAQDLASLARLPSREVLLSQLAGIVQSPIRSLAFLLQGPLRSLVTVLSGVSKKKEKESSSDVKGNG